MILNGKELFLLKKYAFVALPFIRIKLPLLRVKQQDMVKVMTRLASVWSTFLIGPVFGPMKIR